MNTLIFFLKESIIPVIMNKEKYKISSTSEKQFLSKGFMSKQKEHNPGGPQPSTIHQKTPTDYNRLRHATMCTL